MKPLHHYLRRFCSEQVKILLERMDNHFGEEFAGGDSKWDVYTSHNGRAHEYYTTIEAYCVSKTEKEQHAIYKRQQMLNGILERTMSRAVSRWEYEREQRGAMREETEMEAKAGPTKMVVSRAQYEQAKRMMGAQIGPQALGIQPSTALDPQYQMYAQQKQLTEEHIRNWLSQP